MAGTSVKLVIVFFLATVLLFLLVSHYSEAASSSAARPNNLRSSPHFDSFVLFGQIYPHNLKEMTSHRLQLSVELGNHVWLQAVESKYYTFHLPTRNYSELVGRLSVLACEDYVTALWNQSFTVQNDVGAYRLDINVGETLGSPAGQGHGFEGLCGSNDVGEYRLDINAQGTGAIVMGMRKLRSKQALSRKTTERYHRSSKQEATCPFVSFPEIYCNHSLGETKRAGEVTGVQQENVQVLEMVYPRQLIFYTTTLQEWHLAFMVACFAMIQLLNAFVHKSILLLEASVLSGIPLPVGEVSSFSDTGPAACQLCPSKLMQTERHLVDTKNSIDMACVGKSSLEEAWHVAEQYLNRAIDNDFQGAYFSYNCTTPQHERPESALGRWNRDNAGRLIRQLWS